MLLLTILSSSASRASEVITEVVGGTGAWTVVKTSGSTSISYHLISKSTNAPRARVFFDFSSSNDCKPSSATIVMQFDSFDPTLSNGAVIINYQLPTQSVVSELAKTKMKNGNNFAFISLKKLTADQIIKENDRGSLAIWLPASGDGQSERSDNMYISLNGFSSAYIGAMAFCMTGK